MQPIHDAENVWWSPGFLLEDVLPFFVFLTAFLT